MASALTYVTSTSALKLMGDDNPEFVTLAKHVLEYMAANDGTGSLYTSNTGNTNFTLIGTFTDTSYAGNIGEANITVLSSEYNLYQNLSTTFVDWSAVASGILQAAVNSEPGKTLFKDTTIGGRSLGDIDNTGTITSADALSASKYGQGTLTDPTEIAYIENTLEPYMLGNASTYSAYVSDYLGDEPPRPITFNTENNAIVSMTDSQIEDLANNILSWGLVNDGPNSYVLEETAPSDGGTWTSLGTLTDVYANSISTPVETNKNLYKKISSSSYTVNRPLKSIGAGVLREFTDTEINNISRKVKERIAATGIGSYLLQESTPSPGTWVAKGNVINTIATANEDGINYQTTSSAEVPYTSIQPEATFYQSQSSISYTGDDAIPYAADYDGIYEGPGLEFYTAPSTYTGLAFTVAYYYAPGGPYSIFFPAWTAYTSPTSGVSLYYTGETTSFFNSYVGLGPTATAYTGIANPIYNVTNPDAYGYIGTATFTNTSTFFSGTLTSNYLGNRYFVGFVAYASTIYGQHFLGFPYLRNIVSFQRTYTGGSPGHYIAPTARTTNYTGDQEYTAAIYFQSFTPVNYTGTGYFTGPVTYLGPSFFDYTADIPTVYAGPSILEYSSPAVTFYIGQKLSEYTGPGGPIYFTILGTFVGTFAEFQQFSTEFLGPIPGVGLATRGHNEDIPYTADNIDYESFIFQPSTYFYDGFLGPGGTELVTTYFLGTEIYTGSELFTFPSATYYTGVVSAEEYEGVSTFYQGDFVKYFTVFYLGPSPFTAFYVGDYLGPGDVLYTGTDIYTGDYLGLLIEDTPVTVSTITLWRRIA